MDKEYKEAFLTSVSSSIEADFIESQLKFYGIPVLKKYKGMGNYITIVMGNSNLGVDIYVPESALEEAKDILSAEPAIPDDTQPSEEIKKEKSNLRYLVVPAALVILIYVFMMLARLSRGSLF